MDSTALKAARHVLVLALAINAAMFAVEIWGGLAAGSVALLADALDFLGDAAAYAITLFVLSRSMTWRAGAALLKGLAMAGFGLWVAGMVVYKSLVLGLPSAGLMGSVGLAALLANLASAGMLFHLRKGDSNLRSMWLCTRNDVLGNIAVIAAGGMVLASNTPWPDLAVGAVMAGLALSSAVAVLRQASKEMKTAKAPAE